MAPDDGEEITALAPAERSPLEERIRHRRDGPYYIAPDSAEPLPESIWQRIDLTVLHEAVVRSNEQETGDNPRVAADLCPVGPPTSAEGHGLRRRAAKGSSAFERVRRLLSG